MEAPVNCLVKVHADGYVEVFGPRHLRARIVWVPWGAGPCDEILLEDQVDRHIPCSYHFFPGDKRQTAFFGNEPRDLREWVSSQDQTARELEMIHELTRIAKEYASAP